MIIRKKKGKVKLIFPIVLSILITPLWKYNMDIALSISYCINAFICPIYLAFISTYLSKKESLSLPLLATISVVIIALCVLVQLLASNGIWEFEWHCINGEDMMVAEFECILAIAIYASMVLFFRIIYTLYLSYLDSKK